MIDQQLRDVLEAIGDGELFVFDRDDPEEILAGIGRAESQGFVRGHDGGGYNVGVTFRLTAAGRQAIGLPWKPSLFGALARIFKLRD